MRTMRKIHIVYKVLVVSILLMACSEQEEWTDNSISLCAEVEHVMPVSRNYAEPVSDNNLTAEVWFSTEKGKFPEGTDGATETNIPGHYVINFKGKEAAFPNVTDESLRPRYPTDNTTVYCVGFYPKDDWEYVDGGEKSTATHEITGFEDLMFAAPITGSWNQHFSKHQFWHLLAWLKVCVCATTTEAGNYWGKLKKITLKDVPYALQINDLSKMQGEYTGKLTSDDVSPLYKEDGNGNKIEYSPYILNNVSGINLGINTQDVGSIFCYPQSSYTLIIECENGTTKEIPINLKELSGNAITAFPTGYQYVITLYFHPFNVVEGVCTLKEWNAQNEDLYPTN